MLPAALLLAYLLLPSACSSRLIEQPPTRQREGEIARRACPSGFEFEEIGPRRISRLHGVVKVQFPAGDTHPLSSVLVHLTRPEDGTVYSTRSRDDGSFALRDVPRGTYRLTVCLEGYVTLTATLTLAKDAPGDPLEFVTRLGS